MSYILGALEASLLFTGSVCVQHLGDSTVTDLNKRCLCTDAPFHFNNTIINLMPVLALTMAGHTQAGKERVL